MKNRILVLAIAGLILMVMTCGNAIAYSYTNVEWSRISSQQPSGITYYTTAYGNPTVSQGDTLSWQNTLENNIQNANYYPRVSWYSDSWNEFTGSHQSSTTIGYHYVWAPDENALPKNTAGSHTLTVTHSYVWYVLFIENAVSNHNDKSYTFV